METIVFITCCWVLIFIEAVTDAFTYVGWKDSDKKAGTFAHTFQIVLVLLAILFGFILSQVGVELTWINCFLMLITAASWHELLFDRFYNLLLSKNNELGTTSLRDRLWGLLGIQVNSLAYNIIVLFLVFAFTVLLSTKIS
jgi:hypothetical protein